MALAAILWLALSRPPRFGFLSDHVPMNTISRDGATRTTYTFEAGYEEVFREAKKELGALGFEFRPLGSGHFYGEMGKSMDGGPLAYVSILKDTRWRGPSSDIAHDGVAVEVLGAGNDPGWIRVDYINIQTDPWDRIRALFGL